MTTSTPHPDQTGNWFSPQDCRGCYEPRPLNAYGYCEDCMADLIEDEPGLGIHHGSE